MCFMKSIKIVYKNKKTLVFANQQIQILKIYFEEYTIGLRVNYVPSFRTKSTI